MKKMLKSFAIALMLVLVVVSCKKKSTEEDIASLPYASENKDQGKTNLSSAGQQMVTELSTLSDVKGVSASQSLTNYISLNNPFPSISQSTVLLAPVQAASVYGTEKDIKGIMSMLSTSVQSSDTTFKQVFTRLKGKYIWNIALKKWDSPTTSDKIELVFPSTKDGQINNATFVITYTSQKATSVITDLNGDLPTSFDALLSVGSEKVLEYSITAQYDGDGIPTNVSTFFALYPFKFEVTAAKNSTDASLHYLFTNDSKTIFDLYAAVNGTLDQNSLENSNGPEDVFNNANAYFQVFNIKLAGKIDVKNLGTKMTEIDENLTLTSKGRADAQVAALNQYIVLVLMYADTKQKIAQAEFYTLPHTTLFNYTYYTTEIKCTFKDGSKDDLATYFGNGFSSVITDFNKLIVKLNTNFNLGFAPVTY
jgi:hypothetical protein